MFAIAVHPENYRKPMNLLCGQSTEVFCNVKADGTYSYHHKKNYGKIILLTSKT
jgi:hypothetical protein